MSRNFPTAGGRMRHFATAILFTLSWMVSMPALSAPLTTNCGALVSTTIKTDVATNVGGGSVFSSLPGALVVVTVPNGTTRCIKVIFAPGDTTCSTPNACLVRALASSTLALNPAPALASSQHVRSYHEWVRRVGPGTYPVQIQIQSGVTVFTARNWVMEVQVFQ